MPDFPEHPTFEETMKRFADFGITLKQGIDIESFPRLMEVQDDETPAPFDVLLALSDFNLTDSWSAVYPSESIAYIIGKSVESPTTYSDIFIRCNLVAANSAKMLSILSDDIDYDNGQSEIIFELNANYHTIEVYQHQKYVDFKAVNQFIELLRPVATSHSYELKTIDLGQDQLLVRVKSGASDDFAQFVGEKLSNTFLI